MSKTILITGGARSGKSDFAQQLALKLQNPVIFVATAEAGDEEMRVRIEQHKKARPLLRPMLRKEMSNRNGLHREGVFCSRRPWARQMKYWY